MCFSIVGEIFHRRPIVGCSSMCMRQVMSKEIKNSSLFSSKQQCNRLCHKRVTLMLESTHAPGVKRYNVNPGQIVRQTNYPRKHYETDDPDPGETFLTMNCRC
jgi:hypothetical protein